MITLIGEFLMNDFYKLLEVSPLLGLVLGLAMLASGCATNPNMVSDSETPGMTKIVYTINIDAPKAESWKVLADYSNLNWTAGVTSAHYLNDKRAGVGMTRRCNLIDDGYIVERITQWKEGSGFTYVIDDASDPISTDSYVIWSISGDGKRSKVTFEVNYELKYGVIGDLMNVVMAKRKFSNQIMMFMGELKSHVEAQS